MGTSYSKDSQVGKNVLVTGGNSGIGFHTALKLGKLGANVHVLARDPRRGQEAVDAMSAAHPDGRFSLEVCDLSNLEDVKAFAARFVDRGIALDTLVNNAGIMAIPTRELSLQGFEIQTATNHLGHFALTGLLLPALERSSAPRVVNISSLMAWNANFKADTLDWVYDSAYDPMAAYANSKLLNLVFTAELRRRYPHLTVLAAHPGGASTNIQQHKFQWAKPFMQSSENGARASIRAATETMAPDSAATAGTPLYFGPVCCGMGPASRSWWPSAALDAAIGSSVWSKSVEATSVKY